MSKPETAAMHAVATDAIRLVEVKIMAAIEAREWPVVYRLSEQLQEIAQRGMYHQSREKMPEVNKLAMGSFQERECR